MTENATGRPTSYKPEYDDLARKYCLLGATDAELAEFFEVTPQTINNWKHAHPSFFDALKAGRDIADAEIADSLYNRAKGYTRKKTEKVLDQEGKEVEITTEQYFPPENTAMIFWLKNRRRINWRDKQEVEHSNPGGTPLISQDSLDLARFVAYLLQQGVSKMNSDKQLKAPIDAV